VPPDRHGQGYVPGLGIAENIALPVMERVGSCSWLSRRRRNTLARTLANELEIVGSSLEQPVDELSGGNQQKVVMARALSSKPRALVLVHPTSGVDIASKAALFAAIDRAQADGTAVLLVSDEMDELAICDRITVIFDGEVVANFDAGTSERDLVAAIEGVDTHDS
jgi:simple sugar transport system ATP-binding protein